MMRQNWAIILAGGEGERLQPLVSNWLGESIPKQYCAFIGRRSLLEHTFRRACAIAPRNQIVTVLGPGHGRYLIERGIDLSGSCALEQPLARGTLPGILLGVSHVDSRRTDTTLLILPSDHFVYPESRFQAYALELLASARLYPTKLILMAVAPSGPEDEYGWIRPGSGIRQSSQRHQLFQVAGFVEKPHLERARRCLHRGCLWNTMVTAVRLQTLREVIEEEFPQAAADFDTVARVMRAVRQGRVPSEHLDSAIAHAYRKLESLDFSKHLLQRIPERTLVSVPTGLLWSDWGRRERIMASLARIGRRPRFQLEEPVHHPAA